MDELKVAIWNTEDIQIISLLINYVDGWTQSIITHYKMVKELWDFLKFIYKKCHNLN